MRSEIFLSETIEYLEPQWKQNDKNVAYLICNNVRKINLDDLFENLIDPVAKLFYSLQNVPQLRERYRVEVEKTGPLCTRARETESARGQVACSTANERRRDKERGQDETTPG